MTALLQAGEKVGEIEVTIGPQFLNLFSEHLYSSPNKAFEELVSNSWDAGAQRVRIHVPDDLMSDDAAIWVLDDGESMDLDGFKALWAVATSDKRQRESEATRKPIGKFGVGKLATYLLAHELTYVCRARDGITRMVTMDYRRIDDLGHEALHIDPLPLQVHALDDAQLSGFLDALPNGAEASEHITKGFPGPESDPSFIDEFGGETLPPTDTVGTWTLAILSSLKQPGKQLQVGWIRRLLRTALPLGNSINIHFNGENLSSAKSSTDVVREWVLGPNSNIGKLVLPSGDEIPVVEKSSPTPHIFVEGVGPISGSVKLYADRISGGKSEEIEVSNGFFVNIRGRVLKPEDPHFGLVNLSHSVWAKFRATIRADGLDEKLAVNREAISDSHELTAVKALLMKLFNQARVEHDSRMADEWPEAGEVLTEKWGVVPFQPLERVIQDSMERVSPPPEFIDISKIADLEVASREFERDTKNNPGELIKDVVLEELGVDQKLVRYDASSRKVIVNRNHPFAEEHGETSEQLRLLRDAALVELLTDAYMADLGIQEEQIIEIRDYKDRAFRLVAQVRRRSASQIAAMLASATAHAKGFERIVGDALEHVGFSVERMGESGQPEGVAAAIVTPKAGDTHVAYRFTYDAKSSTAGKVKTSNVGIAGLARHRSDHQADHTLVIAPGFEDGALEKECKQNSVTPMLASDLARMVMLTVGFGPLDLTEFRDVFEIHAPLAVTKWVDKQIEVNSKRKHISIGVLIEAINTLVMNNPDRPDMIDCSLISEQCRTKLKDTKFPTRNDVAAAVRGLSLMVPNVISISSNGRDVFLNAPAEKIREAITKQLNSVPDSMKFGIVRMNGE